MIGTLSASTATAIAVAAASTLVVAGLLGAALSLRRSARALHALADELGDHAAEILDDAEATIARARGELDRVDDLVGSAEAITHTVGSASRIAHAALATPVIKVLAAGHGTARAGRRLRRSG